MVKARQPDEKPEEEQQDNPDAALEACARDLISAIETKNVQHLVQVLKDLEDCKASNDEPMENEE